MKPKRTQAQEVERTELVQAKVPLDVKAKLEHAAAAEAETLASYVRRVLVRHAKEL